jgi:hypothetical protein
MLLRIERTKVLRCALGDAVGIGAVHRMWAAEVVLRQPVEVCRLSTIDAARTVEQEALGVAGKGEIQQVPCAADNSVVALECPELRAQRGVGYGAGKMAELQTPG